MPAGDSAPTFTSWGMVAASGECRFNHRAEGGSRDPQVALRARFAGKNGLSQSAAHLLPDGHVLHAALGRRSQATRRRAVEVFSETRGKRIGGCLPAKIGLVFLRSAAFAAPLLRLCQPPTDPCRERSLPTRPDLSAQPGAGRRAEAAHRGDPRKSTRAAHLGGCERKA